VRYFPIRSSFKRVVPGLVAAVKTQSHTFDFGCTQGPTGRHRGSFRVPRAPFAENVPLGRGPGLATSGQDTPAAAGGDRTTGPMGYTYRVLSIACTMAR
jgi:hypothetical protein